MAISWAASAKRSYRMADDYRAGMTLQQVGDKYGVTESAVHHRLKKIGVRMRKGGKPRSFPTLDIVIRLLQGETAKSIAAERGCTRVNLWQRLYVRGIRSRDLPQWRAVLDMDDRALDVLRMALDDDGLLMEDAFDLAMEYRTQRRAA